MRRNIAGLASALTFVALACTGSDPDAPSTDQRGAENQACFENGTCRGGLACVNGLCLARGQSTPDGSGADSSPPNATDGGDAAPIDPGPPCQRAGAVCDSFDTYDGDSLNGTWSWHDENGAGIVLDGQKKESAPNALLSTIGSSGTASSISAIRTRTVTSNGAASWTTAVYIEALPMSVNAEQQLLEVTYLDTSKAPHSLALWLTPTTLTLRVDTALNPSSDSAIEPKLGDWNDLRIDFDLQAQQARAFVNGNTNGALTAVPAAPGGAVENVTLGVGLRSHFSSTTVKVWYDDVQFIPR